MKSLILSTLLHHANRYAKSGLTNADAIYKIKDILLKEYGIYNGFEIQHLEGTTCRDCHGTGKYRKYDYHENSYYKEWCWSCKGEGMFILPQYNQLLVYIWNGYKFHVPFKRNYCKVNPFPVGLKMIEGYIDYSEPRYGRLSTCILFWMYNKVEFKKEIDRIGFSVKWYFRRLKHRYQYLRLELKDFILVVPEWPKLHFIKHDGSMEEISDLPF